MVEQIAWIALCAIIAALSVPATMFGLARAGYFPPIEVKVRGRTFLFAPGSPNMSFSQGSHRRQRSAVIFRLPVAMLR